MFNLSGSEIVVILLLALVVLGPEKLPDALRRAGRTYAELKKMGNSFQAEVKSALDEPMREMKGTADLLRNAADFRDRPDDDDAKPPPRSVRATPPRAVAGRPEPAAEAPAPTDDLINETLSGGGAPSSTGESESAATASLDPVPTAPPTASEPSAPAAPVPTDDLINETLSGGGAPSSAVGGTESAAAAADETPET